MIKTLFDPSKKTWNRRTTAHVPKHDLYFGTPLNTKWAGLPLGDGDMGSLLWLEQDGLHIHINKCDLWNDAPAGVTYDDECYCSDHEEELTSVKHGGELTVRFDSPMFDYVYQKDFAARLSLADASAYVDAETPFGSISARMFASADSRTTVLHCRVTSDEGEAPEIRLARWGSRVLWRWYAKQLPEPEIGLDGTETCADGNRIFITQELNGTKFCLGMALSGDSAIRYTERRNCHEGAIVLDRKTAHDFTIYFTIRLGESVEEAKKLCAETLDSAVTQGETALYEEHKAAWENFWNRSFVSIADDYLENHYYLYLYYMNSANRGAYPPHFTSMLWNAYHDYIAWTYYFHYNLQHMYAPLDTVGHGELASNYYNLRRSGLDSAYKYAAVVKPHEPVISAKKGAFFHDVTDRYGRGASYDSLNCTCGSQIALQMWRHWRYTGDRDFLENYALPIMKGCVEFYLDMLVREEDGLYHIHGTTPYEGNPPTDDCYTDFVIIKALFPIYREFADDIMKARIDNVLANLPAPILVPLEEDDWDGDVFTYGLGRGRKPLGDGKVFGIGYRNGEIVRKTYGNPDSPKRGYGFPHIEHAPLYPAGIFGLKDRNTPMFDNMMNQMYLTDAHPGFWGMTGIYCARMGMAQEMLDVIHNHLEEWQGFPNGFNVESGEPGMIKKGPDWFRPENMHTGERGMVKTEDFTHFDFETTPIIVKALSEAMIQSHEGVIRICPAVRPQDDTAFSLYAEGGFKVDAEITADSYVITVENLRGEGCFLTLPEYADLTKLTVYRSSGGEFVRSEAKTIKFGNEEVLDFSDSAAGELLLLTSGPIEDLETCKQVPAEHNSDIKMFGSVYLGSPRLMK